MKTLFLFAITMFYRPLDAQSDLYFINTSLGIERMKTDGSNRDVLVAWDFVTPQGIALDLQSQKLYWSDWISNKIQRSNLDGSEVEDVVTAGLDLPEGIEIDTINKKIYWVDSGSKKIQRANLADGSGVEDLVMYNLVNLDALALDVFAGKMYWTEWGDGAAFGKIKRANLDGTDIEVLVSIQNAILQGIALDIENGKVYWTDSGYGKIQRANMADGTQVEDLVTLGVSTPNGIDLDLVNGKMYWTDFGAKKINKANLDGSNVALVLADGMGAFQDIVLNISELNTGTSPPALAPALRLRPNPTSGFLTFENLPADSQVAVFDQFGRQVLGEFSLQNGFQLDVLTLPAGSYWARVSHGATNPVFLKFIKI